MHRSGTSALSGALGLAGVALPTHLMPADDANPRGYFESQRLYELHEELLAEMATSWSDVSPPPAGFLRSPSAARWVERLAAAVVEEFGDAPLFVLKDPRICRLVPLWTRVLERLGAEPGWVVLVRNPIETAASLRREHEIDERVGMLLWLDHVLRAERDTRGQRRVVMTYESLLGDWRRSFARIGSGLAIGFPRLSRGAEAEIDGFLSGQLRRQRASLQDVESRHDVAAWVKQVHAWALDADRDDAAPAAQVLDPIGDALQAAEQAFGPAVASLRQEAGSLDQRRAQWRDEAERLRTALEEARREDNRREEELAKVRGETARLAGALSDRDGQLQRMLDWVQVLVPWAASRAAGAAVPEEELHQLLAQLEAVAPGERAAAATAGLRFAAQAAELARLRGRDEEAAALRAELAEVSADVESLERRAATLRTELAIATARAERRERELLAQREAAAARERELVEQGRAELAREREQAERVAAAESEQRARAAALDAELASARSTLAEREEALREARAEIADRLLHLEQLQARIQAIERSLLWRLARPARAVARLARR
jgi:hypothetical protein